MFSTGFDGVSTHTSFTSSSRWDDEVVVELARRDVSEPVALGLVDLGRHPVDAAVDVGDQHDALARVDQVHQRRRRAVEMRLDNLVYRLGFADSRAQARQLVNHGHFAVNGRKTDIPSFIAKPNDVLTVRERSKGLEYFKTRALMLAQKGVPTWLSLDTNAMSGRVVTIPSRTDLELPFDEQMVVEFYQR